MGIIKKLVNKMTSAECEPPSRTPGRNDQCWCGSGKKYKKCHLEEDAKKRSRNMPLNCGPS